MTFSRPAFASVCVSLAVLVLCCSGRAAGEGVPAAAPAAQPAPASARPKPHFDVFEYQVEGNSTLDRETIERAVYPFLGESKTIDDVEAARAQLESVYRDKGYGTVSVRVPVQKVTDGVVILRVEEGRVEHLAVRRAEYYSQGQILETVESLQEGKVPYFPKVQEELAQLNTSPDRKVSPLLRPGVLPGTTDVDLEVTDSLPLHGSVQLDDYYTPLSTAARLTGAIEYDNLFQRDQKLALLFQTSPQDYSDVRLFSLSYTVPVASQFVAFSFVRSDSATVAGTAGVNIFGKGKIIGVHDVIPLEASAPQPGLVFTQYLNLGIDYKDFDQNVTVGQSGSTGFSTPIRYVPFSGSYQATSTENGGEWSYGAGLEFGLRDFANTPAEFDAKRYDALSNFAILRANVSRTQPIGLGMSLYGKLDFQLADQPLVSNEQYIVGGNESVRGYLTASAAGDSGARASVELRSPNLLSAPFYSVSQLEVHYFVDGAYVRIFSPLPEQTATFELLGTGFGFRAHSGTALSLNLDLAWPLRSILYTKAWQPRLQGAAVVSF